jgi:hypothetical protein
MNTSARDYISFSKEIGVLEGLVKTKGGACKKCWEPLPNTLCAFSKAVMR